MKVLISPNSMKGSLSAFDFARAIKRGLTSSGLNFDCKLLPVADGGDGTAEVLAEILNASKHFVAAHDPFMRSIDVPIYITPDNSVMLEMADVSGMKLLKQDELDPMTASTYGLGEIIKYCIEKKYKKLILGIGGSATVDGGVGAFSALGGRIFDINNEELAPLAKNLSKINRFEFAQMGYIDIEIISDVNNPLIGENGAANVFAPQKGANADQVKWLDEGLENWGKLLNKALLHQPMMGAAGGIGVVLETLLKGKMVEGSKKVLELVGFYDALQNTDVVITGEGQIDSQTQQMKAPGVVAEACRKTGKKVYAIAGSVKDNCNFEAAFAVRNKTISLEEAMKNAAKLVEQKAELIAEIIHGSMVDLDRARKFFEEGESQEAYNLVAKIDYDLTDEGDILFCAEVCKKVQQIGSAINWYNRLLELIPDHSGAKTELQMLNSIMAFRYKDLYNP